MAARAMTYLAAEEHHERRLKGVLAENLAAQTSRQEIGVQKGRIGLAERSATERLTEARRLEQAHRWDEASTVLRSIRATLSPFRGAEKEGRLEVLSAEVGAIDDRVTPELEKLRARAAAEERRTAEAAKRREAAAEARRSAAKVRPERSYSSNRVRCCDGTLSPSCTYDYSLRGCCSHHGGVC